MSLRRLFFVQFTKNKKREKIKDGKESVYKF